MNFTMKSIFQTLLEPQHLYTFTSLHLVWDVRQSGKVVFPASFHNLIHITF